MNETEKEFLVNATLLCRLREFLYRDPATNRLDPARVVPPEKLRDFVVGLLEGHDLVPDAPKGAPDYMAIRCLKCQNSTAFEEFSFRETRQKVTVFAGGVAPTHGEAWLLDHAPGFVQKIVCRECGETVWAR